MNFTLYELIERVTATVRWRLGVLQWAVAWRNVNNY